MSAPRSPRTRGIRTGVTAAVIVALVATVAGVAWALRPVRRASAAVSPTAAVRIKPVKRYSGFTMPLYVTGARDGSKRLFVVQKTGVIKVIPRGSSTARTYLDLRRKVSKDASNMYGERGLLGLAFAPDFKTSGHFYVNYTDLNGDTRIERYRATPASSNTPRITFHGTVMKVTQPFANHNGGCLQFGPDGMLYIGMGDGGSGGDPGNRAQNPQELLGKILRIDVGDAPTSPSDPTTYTIPPTNPFVGNNAYRPEIYALGFRNPWRFSFDRSTGDMWIGDVGQRSWEEVDFMASGTSGLNFGWNVWEGTHAYPETTTTVPPTAGFTFPVATYGHPDNTPPDRYGGEAVIGGYVYRGGVYPAMRGLYLMADMVTCRIWTVRRSVVLGTATYQRQRVWGASKYPSWSSFGESDAGEIYLCDLKHGGIYRMQTY